ncbi:Ig-like domain-containing protein [Desulfurivibrio alkaliphilus]|uniref:Ig domain protein group 1 domain protein n=1 Tax=Desulfurivibrio alkaliphilus (strain DSM 19089 / UNIQEM U267 / AHT2) TaxID=589865 RepID=D6Z6Y5_DESAT|nr:Ig-like domain-containing protein [Desulfurivibrio alkaliphilus]ADH86972.1 Ig domain protein group 1 domain protein [Desulfurivibrio alkaliphilus AHT 2]
MLNMAKTAGYGVLLLLLLFIFSACAENKNDDDNDIDNGEFADVGSITLLASSPELPSASTQPVTLDAIVYDTGNVLMQGVTVSFSIVDGYSGSLAVVNATTDEAGRAQALLSTPGDKSNREIQVRARAGTVSDTVSVMVTGTEITLLTAPGTATHNSTIQLEVALRDSAGAGIQGITLAAESAAENDIAEIAPTNASGRTTIAITVTNDVEDTITISGAGTAVTHTFQVTPDIFVFIAPTAADGEEWPELELDETYEVTLQWTHSGAPVAGEEINFHSARGSLLPPTATTDAEGKATVNLTATGADGAGLAKISAEHQTQQATTEVLFVATVADSMTLQADPAIIAPGEQSEIVATVRDPLNNLVKNKTVKFSLADNTSGVIDPISAITDRYGRARTTYYAGDSSSALDEAVEITAQVSDAPAVNKTVTVTVGGAPLFITLGTSNVIGEYGELSYALPYGVLVTDSAGGPVAGAKVTLSIWPTHYYKGFYTWGGSYWVPTTTAICENEDVNRDGIEDAGEDQNNSGNLTPGNVVTLSNEAGTATTVEVITGDDGFGHFDIRYFRELGHWIRVELTARAMVAGSEGKRSRYFRLPMLADDLNDSGINPPGNPSPFGESGSCFDTL